jgi:cystathionine beta-lyase/cystathionine gamma-synthase
MNNDNQTILLKNTLDNMPTEWLALTTHRLDIYNEDQAKVQFLEGFEKLIDNPNIKSELLKLPTAFDYIRLGHPLSCLLEWKIAKSKNIKVENVISFSSKTMPILAILRKNFLINKKTQIYYQEELPACFNSEILENIYNYKFDLQKISNINEISKSESTNVLLLESNQAKNVELGNGIDFIISMYGDYGSVALVDDEDSSTYVSEILHVRRRESIAMTPKDCLDVLNNKTSTSNKDYAANKASTLNTIKEITNTNLFASLGSCGLSIQYAIMMGLIHESTHNYKGQDIKLIVPPNCYGGTNDQARRAAACISNVEIMDLPVDGGQDMVQSIEKVLGQVADMDAIPFIIAEIPTNPRVEVPDLNKLKAALSKKRLTKSGKNAVEPIFILDQTFCPNVNFLGEEDILSSVKTISYVSGSKFPSGGLCTSGYCVANKKAEYLMSYIDNHLKICDNEATELQVEILAKQMPSMIKRVSDAYKNTRSFVDHIQTTLPDAKINFVSHELAQAGFTPSVFSLDLPTIGSNPEELESYKRDLNHKLISMMINEIPNESKHCVSYGQLKGCYWTIPATSTQGTTKEGDKDYIVRVAVSADFDLDHHKKVFTAFCSKFF